MSTGQFWFTLYSVVLSNIWLFLKIWYHIPSVCIIWYTDPNLIVLIGMFTYAFRGKWDDSFRTHSRHSHIEPWFPGHKSMGCAPNDVTSSKNFGRYGKSTISRSFCFPNGNSMDFHIFVILPDGTARKKNYKARRGNSFYNHRSPRLRKSYVLIELESVRRLGGWY